MLLRQLRENPSRWLSVGLVVSFFALALFLRVYLPYDKIFTPDGIRFAGVDAYYHMRLVDSLAQNFPQRITFDPYTSFPYGSVVFWAPFFDWLLGGIIWLVSLGKPTPHTVDLVGVYYPAVLAALVTIPVFFIGRLLAGNRWAGVLAAGLVAIMPGEYLGRSILGFTDHHIAEALFSTVAMLFLLLAVKSAAGREWTIRDLGKEGWQSHRRPLVYSLLAGFFLGLYFLTWTGALLFIFIIFSYFIVQSLVDTWQGRGFTYLVPVGAITSLVALVMVLPISPGGMTVASLVIGGLAPLALHGVVLLLKHWRLAPFYPLALVLAGLAGMGVLRLANPTLLQNSLYLLTNTLITSGTTIFEAQPILRPGGEFSFSPVWGNFTTGSFLSLIALGLVGYRFVRQGSSERGVLLVWSLLILLAMLAQRRFAYYFAVNVSLLTGYLSWLVLEQVGKATTRPVAKKARGKHHKQAGGTGLRPALMGLGVVVVLASIYLPNIGPAVNTARQVPFAPSTPWAQSLTWLKANTPEPFGNAEAYYQAYTPPPPGQKYQYPPTAYGVMAWWDYGHWITRVAHRLPNATPGAWGSAGAFFASTDEASANKLLDELGIRYVIADYAMAVNKFYAIPTLASKNPNEYFDYFYVPEQRGLVQLFLPAYYRSMMVRLHAFEGKAVTPAPKSATVVSYKEAQPYKEVTGAWGDFPSYAEAAAFVSSKSASDRSAKYLLVGTDPLASPVPLEALTHYRLLYSAGDRPAEPSGKPTKEIKIFEYIK